MPSPDFSPPLLHPPRFFPKNIKRLELEEVGRKASARGPQLLPRRRVRGGPAPVAPSGGGFPPRSSAGGGRPVRAGPPQRLSTKSFIPRKKKKKKKKREKKPPTFSSQPPSAILRVLLLFQD